MFMAPMSGWKTVETTHEPRGTSNIEPPTPNIEWQRESSLTSAFGVRCWTFDVFPRFRGSSAILPLLGKRDGVWASDISHSFRNSPKNLGSAPRGRRLPFENRRPFDL